MLAELVHQAELLEVSPINRVEQGVVWVQASRISHVEQDVEWAQVLAVLAAALALQSLYLRHSRLRMQRVHRFPAAVSPLPLR